MRDPRKAFEQKLVEMGAADSRICAVSCDSAGGGGLGAFFADFPDRSIELGISEQSAVSICAAMSRQRLIPVLVIINPFLTMRAFEQIRDDLGYMRTNVKVVGSGGGLAYSTLGASHIAVEDIGLMRTVPNLTIFAPGDAAEVEFALEQAMAIDGPVYIRMPRQAREEPLPSGERLLVPGEAELLRKGEDTAIFTYGPSACEASKASDMLKKEKIASAVINLITVKPLDEATVLSQLMNKRHVFTLEEHNPVGGIGSIIAEIIARNGIPVRLHVLAVPEGAKNTGPYHELVDAYGLSAKKVAARVKTALRKN
ncbi:MAG TPA: transketolase C-terminal domain-containing protein [Clostridia bacterium]|nr:transketolase C-terminal domain-containing protein [Clostridia bacterium]